MNYEEMVREALQKRGLKRSWLFVNQAAEVLESLFDRRTKVFVPSEHAIERDLYDYASEFARQLYEEIKPKY